MLSGSSTHRGLARATHLVRQSTCRPAPALGSSRALALRRYLAVDAQASNSDRQPARNVIDELEARGFVQAVTSPHLSSHLDSPSTVYAGVDPSASSLHVGNLLPLLGLLHFRARGHHALALIGGATGAIGDPSGRSTERNALSQEELAHNIAGITYQVERFFERGIAYAAKRGYDIDPSVAHASAGGRGFDVVNNHDWFKDVSFLDFLRDVGKYARVNVMMQRDSVRNRLESEQGISFTEFSYQLLQAHDFATLYKTRNCRVQLGGSDQWGNIVAGIDLIKRVHASDAVAAAEGEGEAPDPAYGLTMPLLTTSSGEKFGKSAGNAVWLAEERTSVSDFYQFFFSSPDADVAKYLSILTLVPPAEIRDIMKEHEQDPKKKVAQKRLAEEVTELVHGPAAVSRAQNIHRVLFTKSPHDLSSADVVDLFAPAGGVADKRFVRVSSSDLKGTPISKLAVETGLFKSRGEATRAISGKGLYINNVAVDDPRREILQSDLIDGHMVFVRKGKAQVLIFYVDTSA